MKRRMTKKSKNKTKDDMGPVAHKATKQHQNQISTQSFTRAHNVFTLADEARQTSQHDHAFWSPETKLRSVPISFISAGISEPLKSPQYVKTDGHQHNTGMPSNHNASKTEAETTGHRSVQKTGNEVGNEDVVSTSEANDTDNGIFYYDTGRGSPGTRQERGEVFIPHTLKEATTESERSDSDREIILFKGRLNTARKRSDNIDMKNIRTEICAVEREIEEQSIRVKEQKIEETAKQKNMRGRRGGRQAKAKRAAADVLEEEDDGMLADYIANMRESGEMHEMQATATAPEETEDDIESSADSMDGNKAEEPSVEALLATKPNTQTSNWATGKNGMEYTDFDPMDWERPSLRRKQGKGAKQKLDLRFADIDSETERRLQTAWQSDRLRKAERKKEREQLRTLQLIGKKAEKSDAEDMRIKYPKGISLEQVGDELRKFLLSFDNSICLPPMDKHARKMIHELANKFNVKSKSIGKADQRRPNLYRTKRTLRFDDEAFDSAVRRIHRRYFPRLDYKGKSSQEQPSRNGYAEASYRDGEVVGASAPELSTENRGRAMLEKMGWSTGTALGSEDNKGILLPVMQTMKRSKAGLG